MKNFILTILTILLATVCLGQTPPPPATTLPNFTISASVLGLSANGQAAVATDIGGALRVTDNYFLRTDNYLAPAFNWTGFYGSLQGAPPQVCALLKKTKLTCDTIQPYFLVGMGESRISIGSVNTNHFGLQAGGGINYGTGGSFSYNLFEIKYVKAPGLVNNTWFISTGPQINWTW